MGRQRALRPFLIQSHSDMHSGAKLFETGALVTESGIYRVMHSEHRLPHEATCLAGDKFPRCAKCSAAVKFELLRAAPLLQTSYHLYELPVLDQKEEARSA